MDIKILLLLTFIPISYNMTIYLFRQRIQNQINMQKVSIAFNSLTAKTKQLKTK